MISFVVHFVKQHFLIILCCVITAFIWPNLRENLNLAKKPETAQEEPLQTESNVISTEQLALFNGVENEKLYLSILGSVYDVSKGAKHYGRDGTYNYFVGKDASVAFITGDFEKSSDPDYQDDDVLKHLGAQEIYSIHQWKQFYDKEYKFVGLLSGRFYAGDGQKTEYMKQVDERIKHAIEENERQAAIRNQYPPCNIEWKESTGTRVWCTDQSGGIDRDWVGVPRKLFEVGKSDFRCACVPTDRVNDSHLKEYDNCGPNETQCFYTA